MASVRDRVEPRFLGLRQGSAGRWTRLPAALAWKLLPSADRCLRADRLVPKPDAGTNCGAFAAKTWNGPDPMKQTTTKTLYGYWDATRGSRLAPRRFEIEPARIADILSDTLILERGDDLGFRFRLAGTRICDTFGQELRGTTFTDGWSAEDRSTLQRHLAVISREAAVGVFQFEAETAAGRTACFELLLLPLMHTRETVDRILGSIVAIDRPDWLGHEPLVARWLLSSEIVWPKGREPVPENSPKRTQAPFMAHVHEARIVRADRRQFRVYEGGLSKSDG